jgi:aminocarboxymuconate-semialdehyde decarboxylase
LGCHAGEAGVPIDTHAHYVPKALLAAIERDGAACGVSLVGGNAIRFASGFQARPIFPALIEPVEARLAWLATAGIDHQIVATWPDIFGYGLPEVAGQVWHRMLNDTLAAWCAGSEKFSWLASVPLSGAAAELERAVASGAVGAILPANVEGTNLGEIDLEAFWARAAALGVTVLLHPVMTVPVKRAAKYALAQIVQYTFDTTLGLGSLIGAGVLDRHPGLSLMVSHGGGAFPYLAGRFDVMHERMDRATQGIPSEKTPSGYLGRLAFDSIVHDAGTLRFLVERAGVGNVALGSDYSFPPADLDPVGSLCRAGLSASEIEAIGETTPRRLFPRLE